MAVHDTTTNVTSIPSGNHRVFDSFGMPTAPITDGFLFGYTGREYDSDTGLQYNRARWYDPAVGRFVSEDPIGFSAGDTNLNRYGSNNPATGADPSGNSWLSSLWHKIQGGVKKLAHKAIDGVEELVTHPLRFIKNLPKHLVEGVEDAASAVAHNYEDAGHVISENFKDAEHWVSEHAKEIEIAIAVVTTVASGGLAGPEWAAVLAGQELTTMAALSLTASTLGVVDGALNTYQLTTGNQVGGRDFMPYLGGNKGSLLALQSFSVRSKNSAGGKVLWKPEVEVVAAKESQPIVASGSPNYACVRLEHGRFHGVGTDRFCCIRS